MMFMELLRSLAFLLYITCDSGFCGSRCAELCLDDNAAGNFTRTSTIADLDVQQNSKQTESLITVVTTTVLAVLVLIGLIMLLIFIVITARKRKGKCLFGPDY